MPTATFSQNKCFSAIYAQLCALRTQDLHETLTNWPLLIPKHSGSYAVTLKNVSGSQKSQNCGIRRALRAIARTVRTGSRNPDVGTGVLDRRTFGLSYVALQPCLLPLLAENECFSAIYVQLCACARRICMQS